MDFLKKNKTIASVVILALFVLLYFVFFSSSTPSLSSTDSTSSDPVSASLLVTLSNLHTIRLDGSIFSDPTFVSLTDFGVVIPPEPAGRRNPFAAPGAAQTQTSTGSATRTTSSTTTQTTTKPGSR